MDAQDIHAVHLIGPHRRGRYGIVTLCEWEVDERQKSRLTHHESVVTCDACLAAIERDKDIGAGLTSLMEGGA